MKGIFKIKMQLCMEVNVEVAMEHREKWYKVINDLESCPPGVWIRTLVSGPKQIPGYRVNPKILNWKGLIYFDNEVKRASVTDAVSTFYRTYSKLTHKTMKELS